MKVPYKFFKKLLTSQSAPTISTHKAVLKVKDIQSGRPQLNSLNKQIHKIRFLDRLENTTEVVMDAQVMKMTHELLGSLVQTMDNTDVSDDEFVAAIVSIRREFITENGCELQIIFRIE